MKKDNVKIKDNITIADEAFVIQEIVEYYFTDGAYTPFYEDMAKVTVVAQNFIDGVTFEQDDYVYDLVMKNEDLYKCVKKFIAPSLNKSDAQYYERMERIMAYVADIVDFKKQQLIHNSEAFSIVGDMCNAIKDILDGYIENAELAKGFMTELKENGINEDTLTTAIRNAADRFKLPENDVIIGQRQRISEQQEQLVEKEAKIQELLAWKREHMARNVKAVAGSGKISDGGVNNAMTPGTIPADKTTKKSPTKTKRTSAKKKTDEK